MKNISDTQNDTKNSPEILNDSNNNASLGTVMGKNLPSVSGNKGENLKQLLKSATSSLIHNSPTTSNFSNRAVNSEPYQASVKAGDSSFQDSLLATLLPVPQNIGIDSFKSMAKETSNAEVQKSPNISNNYSFLESENDYDFIVDAVESCLQEEKEPEASTESSLNLDENIDRLISLSSNKLDEPKNLSSHLNELKIDDVSSYRKSADSFSSYVVDSVDKSKNKFIEDSGLTKSNTSLLEILLGRSSSNSQNLESVLMSKSLSISKESNSSSQNFPKESSSHLSSTLLVSSEIKNVMLNTQEMAETASIEHETNDDNFLAFSLGKNAISCETILISQVKQASAIPKPGSFIGNSISVTRDFIAYVLNGRKVRLIAQENAASAIISDIHEQDNLPIIGISWMTASKSDSKFLESPRPKASKSFGMGTNDNILATLSCSGEICIGHVYSQSSTSLVYQKLSTIDLSLLSPVRGLVWSPSTLNEIINVEKLKKKKVLLAVYGGSDTGSAAAIISSRGLYEENILEFDLVAYLNILSGNAPLVDAIFDENGRYLVLASLSIVYILTVPVQIESVEWPMPPIDVDRKLILGDFSSASRLWLHRYRRDVDKSANSVADIGSVVLAVSLRHLELTIYPIFIQIDEVDGSCVPYKGNEKMGIPSEISISFEGLFSDYDEKSGQITNFITNSPPEHLFSNFDENSQMLTIGCLSLSQIVCINLECLTDPKLAIGEWPNDKGSMSVVTTSQLGEVFPSSQQCLYAHHTDSVKLHLLKVDWSSYSNENVIESNSSLESEPLIDKESLEIKNISQDISNTISSLEISPKIKPVQKLKVSDDYSDSYGTKPSKPLTNDGVESMAALKNFKPSRLISRSQNVSQLNRQVDDNSKAKVHNSSFDDEKLSTSDFKLPKVVQSIQSDVVEEVLERVLRSEIKTALNHKLSTLSDQISTSIDRCISSATNHLISQTFVDTKALADAIFSRILPQIRISQELTNAIERSLLPGLVSALRDIISVQLSEPICRSIVSASAESHDQIISEINLLKARIDNFQSILESRVPSIADISATFERVITNLNVSCKNSVLEDNNKDFVSSRTKNIKDSDFSGNSKTKVAEFLKNGEHFKALVHVLEAADMKLLNWLLPKINPEETLDSPQLSLAVMLSLAQQLGCDLETLTILKLEWLSELFLILPGLQEQCSGADASIHNKDRIINETAPQVFEELFANLRVLFAQMPVNSSYQKLLKTVMRLIRLAM